MGKRVKTSENSRCSLGKTWETKKILQENNIMVLCRTMIFPGVCVSFVCLSMTVAVKDILGGTKMKHQHFFKPRQNH